MGYEYYIAKPEKKEFFCLGKGNYAGPLEEVGKFDFNPEIHITNNLMLEHNRYLITKSDIGVDREFWINFYAEYMGFEISNDQKDSDEEAYWREVAAKIFDWMGGDDCWLYGDHFLDVVEYLEWKETGTRYVS